MLAVGEIVLFDSSTHPLYSLPPPRAAVVFCSQLSIPFSLSLKKSRWQWHMNSGSTHLTDRHGNIHFIVLWCGWGVAGGKLGKGGIGGHVHEMISFCVILLWGGGITMFVPII